MKTLYQKKKASQSPQRFKREYLVIHGPPASGKTLNKEVIKKVCSADHVFDADFERDQARDAYGKILLFSNDPQVRAPDDTGRPYRYVMRKIPIEIIKRALGSLWVEPDPQWKAGK